MLKERKTYFQKYVDSAYSKVLMISSFQITRKRIKFSNEMKTFLQHRDPKQSFKNLTKNYSLTKWSS